MKKYERIDNLREKMMKSSHKVARIELPEEWNTQDMTCHLPQRKAYALKKIFDNMPLFIEDEELIVGTRTVYKKYASAEFHQSRVDVVAIPEYVNDKDIEEFGFDERNTSQGHYTCDYSILLKKGIEGILEEAQKGLRQDGLLEDQVDFYESVIIVYQGLQQLIQRYSAYACELAEHAEGTRKQELGKIASVCKKIAHQPADDYYEACQLFWFGHLGSLIENYQFMNYGRVDQMLIEYAETCTVDELNELTRCLLLKMYDMADVEYEYLGCTGKNYAGQHNVTLGGLKPEDGSDACNVVTMAILEGVEQTNLPEPLLSVRIHKQMDPKILNKACELSIDGYNFIAYYNDDLFVPSLIAMGIKETDARDYSFDLCQDITIAGKATIYCAGGVGLTEVLMKLVDEVEDTLTYEELITVYKKKIQKETEHIATRYSKFVRAIDEYNKGNKQIYFDGIEKEEFPRNGYVFMSPLPLSSVLFEGCLERGISLTRNGNTLKEKGMMVCTPVIAVNALAALKKCVYDEKRYTLSQVVKACKENFQGQEAMRQRLLNAPKWGNDEDEVDLIGKDVIEFALQEILKYRQPNGERYLAGVHQPHPVPTGMYLPATPEGRLAGMPCPVTLSPENGTMRKGQLAALKSAAKLDSALISWNNCVMTTYFSTLFSEGDGADIFKKILLTYFEIGGMQHQPNVVSVQNLKEAQQEPEKYKDLIVRLWGVSAHFVDITKEMQNEFIARFEV